MLCHSSHSRVSKTVSNAPALISCFATVHILASARPNQPRLPHVRRFATVHILASARRYPKLPSSMRALPQFTFSRQQDRTMKKQEQSMSFATVHILASARQKQTADAKVSRFATVHILASARRIVKGTNAICSFAKLHNVMNRGVVGEARPLERPPGGVPEGRKKSAALLR